MTDNKQRTALYVGTFDPFTIGHANIVERALALFDRLVIGVGVNPRKHTVRSAEERVKAIEALYKENEAVAVVTFDDMTVDLAQRVGACCVVRGIRSSQDFEFEKWQADFNHQLGKLETVVLYAEPTLANLSSSAVRELELFGKDVSAYLPKTPVSSDEKAAE